jgi:hypothetical protein
MQYDLNQSDDSSASARQSDEVRTAGSQYASPVMYLMGRSDDLVQGSTGRMYDDAGARAHFRCE